MELITLNAELQLDKLVENYQSLLWTERYDTNGDFELVSNDIPATMAALPKESYVTLRETTVPMVVETHKIEKRPKQAPVITVKGRSFETVLERRAAVNSLPAAAARAAWSISAAKQSDAAYKAMRVVLGDISRTRTDNSMPLASEVAMGAEVLPALSPAVSPKDAIPEINLILPKDYSTLTPTSFEIEPKDLYTSVINLLKANHRGIKAVRPEPDKNQIDIEIYNGADLRELVAFDARFDQFDSSTYLLSEQGSTNVGYVYGSNGATQVLRNVVDAEHPEPSGLARRVWLVDGGGDESLNSESLRTSRGLVELYQHNPTALFDGEISVQVAAGYNNVYFLGDILLLVGEYGLTETVRVSEFIRSSDQSGEKAYPTLEVVEV